MRRMILAAAAIAFALGAAGCRGQGQALVDPAAEPEKKLAAKRKQPEIVAEFKIAKGGRVILVPVRINGQERLFVVDTGSSLCFLDTSFKPKKGLFDEESAQAPEKISIRTAAGQAEFEVSDQPRLLLGECDLRQAGRVCWLDFELLRRVADQDLRGVLGMSFLKKYVVQMDFDSGTLRLLLSDGLGRAEWGKACDLHAGECLDCPYISGNVQGSEGVDLLVDSGYIGSVVLGAEGFEKARDKTAVMTEALSVTAAGVHRSRKTRIGSLVLGEIEQRGLVMEEGTPNRVGLDLLCRYVVTFDFPGKKMYLRKGKKFDRPDEEEMSGLNLWRIEGNACVHSLAKGHPAEAAGIMPGDIVLNVGNKDVSKMSLEQIYTLLNVDDGKEIKLTIKRGDAEKVVTLKLKKRI
jgi:predicted aspartyl protease